MKILYLRLFSNDNSDYVPEQILDKDFNFSDKYLFEYDNGNITINSINNENFFNLNTNNIYNITAIIGGNGSGKSSILSILIKILYDKKNNYKYIIGFEEDGKIIIFKNFKENITCSNNITVYTVNSKEIMNIVKNSKTSLIYFSDCFSWSDRFLESKEKENYYNCSLNNILKNDSIKSSDTLYNYNFVDTRYSDNEFNDIKNETLKGYIEMFSKMSIFDVNVIKVIPKILISNNIESIFTNNRNKSTIEYNLLRSAKNILINDYSDVEKKKTVILLIIIDMLFAEINGKVRKKSLAKNILNSIYPKKIKMSNKIDYEYIKSILINLLNTISLTNIDDLTNDITINFYELYSDKANLNRKGNIENFITDLLKDFSLISKKYMELIRIFEEFIYTNNTISKIDYMENKIHEIKFFIALDRSKFKKLVSLIDYIDNNFSLNPFIYDYKRQSSGFYAKLDMYASINNVIKKISSRTKYYSNDYVLILDEPDLYFHPMWSRKLISDLIEFLSQYKKYNFQIILTSNKPYIISDLPKENVILIGDNQYEDNNTFAANIIDLLGNEYFMDSFMGEFAISKIKTIIEKIKNNNIDDSVINTVNMIGDPVLKKSILRLMNSVVIENDKNK